MEFRKGEEIPALDGLRAIACILVVISHMPIYITHSTELFRTPILFGEAGVAIFFSLSGFLMAHLYCNRKYSISNLVSYSVARFSRIAPIYWMIVIFCFIMTSWFDPDFIFQINSENIVRHMLFIGSEGVFWSIAPEVQYYVYFLLLWYSLWQMKFSNRVYILGFTCLSMLFIYSRGMWPGITIPSKLHLFISGSLVALLYNSIISRFVIDRYLIISFQLISVVLLVIATIKLAGMEYPEFYHSSMYFVFATITIFAFSFRSFVGDIAFGNRLLRWLGRVSFSVYLIHGIVIYAFDNLLVKYNFVGVQWDILVFLLAILIPGLFSSIVELPLCRITKIWLNRLIARWLTLHQRREVRVGEA